MPTDIKFSRAQISKKIQSGRFLDSLLSKVAGVLMKVAVPLAKKIRVVTSAIDAGIYKKIHGSETKTLMISNKQMSGIVQALKD